MLQFRSVLAIGVAWACSWCVACTSDDDSQSMEQPATGAAVGGSLVPPPGGAGGMMMTVPPPPPPGGMAGTPVTMPMAGTGVPNNDAGKGGNGMAGSAGSAGMGGMAGGSAGMGGMAGSAGMGGGMSGSAGSAGSAGSMSGTAATFTDVYSIISMKCGGGTTGCHVTGKSGGLQMPNKATARMNLVNVNSQECPGNKRVTPGDPAKSILVTAVDGTACVQRMPRGKPALSADEIAKFRSWVQAGALDD